MHTSEHNPFTQPPETTPVSGDEVERVARALCRTFGENPNASVIAGDLIGNPVEVDLWELWQPDARKFIAALHPTDQQQPKQKVIVPMYGTSAERGADPAAIRHAALEEAARVAEGANDGLTTTHTKIAAAIRGLVKEVG